MLRMGMESVRVCFTVTVIALLTLLNSVGLAADEPLGGGGLLKRLWGRKGRVSQAGGGAARSESRKAETAARLSGAIRQVSATRSEQPPAGTRSLSDSQVSSFNSQPASLTLDQLEQLARANNPTLAQAAAVVDAARGRQIQAGLYPNPTVAYIGSEIGNEGRGGQQGIVVGQEIVRGGKLLLARSVAGYERERAEAQAAAQTIRVLNSVRSLFYETLAAEQTLALTRELAKLAEQGVSVAQQLEAFEGTLAETLQAQIESERVRILESNSANNYRATWKRLAAAVGYPEMTPVPLVGELESQHGARDEAAGLDRLTRESPEILVAQSRIRRAEMAVARARVEPVSNVTVEAGTQYDFASNDAIASVAVSFPLPIFNQNQGNILAAESELVQSQRELDRVKLSLADRFALAFARYQNALQQVERYGTRLPDAQIKRLLELVGEERQRELDKHPQILPRAQLALALATEGWRRGEFGYIQVLTAQRTLIEASLSYVRAAAELRQSAVALDGYLLTDGLAAAGSSQPDPSLGVYAPE